MRNRLIIVIAILYSIALLDSCAATHNDCNGNKHKVKTEMGGYL